MTHISRATILHLAQLSRLQLDDSEVDSLTIDITNILGYVKQLDELNTDGVEPTYQVTGLKNVWRRDEATRGSANREQLLALAPEQADNQVKVPKVL